MDAMETLNGLLRENPSYACLCLLESAVASRKYWPEAGLPEALVKDMIQALGQTRFREAESLLLDAGVLEQAESGQAAGLKGELVPDAEALLCRLWREQDLGLDGGMKAGWFFDELMQALLAPGTGVSLRERGTLACTLEFQGESYRLITAFSPFWLPLETENSEEDGKYALALGPFSDRNWEVLYPYFDLEEFRTRVGLYDPWQRRKMNLCSGGLPVLIDWFFRDRFGGRFSIPADFCEALHNMGLLRYNDER